MLNGGGAAHVEDADARNSAITASAMIRPIKFFMMFFPNLNVPKLARW